MADCPKLASCAFFHNRLPQMPMFAAMMKQAYCLGDQQRCARGWVSEAGIAVPFDLMPNERDRAKNLVTRAGQ